jgi:hypothetical protein
LESRTAPATRRRNPKPHQPNFNFNNNYKTTTNNNEIDKNNNKNINNNKNKYKNKNNNRNTLTAANFAVHGSGQLRFWANNACSLNKDKKDELIGRLGELKRKSGDERDWPHVILFTKTWFNENSDAQIAGYVLHRADRNRRNDNGDEIKGGGVAMYIKKGITSHPPNVTLLVSSEVEQI